MFNESRTKIYDYVYNLLYGVVTENVYPMYEPQELLKKDTQEGFIVIRVGQINDESQFRGHTYAWTRVFVEAYVPTISRGRFNRELYNKFESKINEVINNEIDNGQNENYTIQDDGVVSLDGSADTNANNLYHMYVKSFIVTIQ